MKNNRQIYLMDIIIGCVLLAVTAVTIYPLIYVISMSISSADAVLKQEVFLFPKGFSVGSYKLVLQNQQVWRAYYNTIWYTVVGTTINIAITIMAGYALSRRVFFLGRPAMILIVITMFFSGGLVPLFVLVSRLGLYDTRWAIILPVAVNTWNLIITRTYMQISIHESLPESAKIDGCTDIRILLSIVLPLAKPIIAVLTIFYAVFHWNSWFSSTLFLSDVGLHPLQVYLRKLLIQAQLDTAYATETTSEYIAYIEQLKYSTIVVATLPILCVYPFLQKYFVQGVMLGSIKE